MAEHLLKREGILRIVDRARALIEGKEDEMLAAMIEGHEDQASVTSLKVDHNVSIRPYTPPVDGTGIGMKPADTTKFEYDDKKLAFWSVIATKP